MKYKTSKNEFDCVICGVSTPEQLNGLPVCFDCIERIQSGDNDDIKARIELGFSSSIEGIIQNVQKFTGIEDLTIKTREREVLEARQIAHKLARDCNCGSFALIGWRIGRKDHATVINSVKTVNNLLDTDKQFKNKYGAFIKSYNSTIEEAKKQTN